MNRRSIVDARMRCRVLALGQAAYLETLGHSDEFLQVVVADMHLAQVHVLQDRLQDLEFHIVHVEHGVLAGIRLERDKTTGWAM